MRNLLEFTYPTLLILIFSGLFFVGLSKPVIIDLDEGAYAEVSREMYLDSEAIVPTFNGEDYFEKPPMLYWMQMLGYHLFGISTLGARFFNALSGVATILILYIGARGALGARTAFHASLILGSSFLFVYLSRVAMTDMLLTMFLTLCLVSSWYGVERTLNGKNGTGLFWLGCLSAALAMLSKGAIGALFPILTALIYLSLIGRLTLLFRKNWILPGAMILIVIGFSWYLLLGFVHPEGFGFMKELFLKHHLGRFTHSMEGHSGSVFYYVIILLVAFVPWFSYLPIAIIHLPIRNGSEPGVRFLRLFIIYTLIVFLFFTAAATKLPNYILPALPGLSLCIAVLFNRAEIKRPLPWHCAGWLSAILVIVLGLVLASAPFIIPYLGELLGENARKAPALAEPLSLGYTPWFSALILIVCGMYIIYTTRKHVIGKIFEALLLCSFLVSATLSLAIIPVYDKFFDLPLTRLAQEAAARTPEGGVIVLYEVDDRPSINFTAHRRTTYLNDRNYRDLPSLFYSPETSVGITTAYHFEQLQRLGVGVVELSRDTGFILFSLEQIDTLPTGTAVQESDTS
ncbi:MAG: glycosyltransferase family 39 protein [Desulfobacterales bacterium]|nr:glycosyltransferase family 39 protein [Desulfobacterales bacterium]